MFPLAGQQLQPLHLHADLWIQTPQGVGAGFSIFFDTPEVQIGTGSASTTMDTESIAPTPLDRVFAIDVYADPGAGAGGWWIYLDGALLHSAPYFEEPYFGGLQSVRLGMVDYGADADTRVLLDNLLIETVPEPRVTALVASLVTLLALRSLRLTRP